MRIPPPQSNRGIALIIVMIVIMVLTILAGGFAYSMKVETKLARNASFETELEWMGRSGVELGRFVICQELTIPSEPWDSLNQKWAGGPAGTNEALADISLTGNRLGPGTFSVRIVDLERRFNINAVNEEILQRALAKVSPETIDFPTIIDAFRDWLDSDDDPHLSGAETRDYMSQPNPGFAPYRAKNGPIDDVTELLRIRGVTPEMFWGSGGTEGRIMSGPKSAKPVLTVENLGESTFSGGLVGLFTAVSAGMININTAPVDVLSLVPGIDDSLARAIVATRAGLDGLDGTEDDTPFRSPGELINVPGMDIQIVGQMRRFLTTRSVTFQIEVDAEINGYHQRYVAVVRRNGMRDARILYFFRE